MSTTDKYIAAVKKMIVNNRRITTRDVSDDVSISYSLRQAIFKDVSSVKRAAAKIFPKLLNFK